MRRGRSGAPKVTKTFPRKVVPVASGPSGPCSYSCVGHSAARHAHARPTEWRGAGGGRPRQRAEERGTGAAHTRKRREIGGGRPLSGGACAAKAVKRPRQQPAHPQYANYWAPLTRKRHILPHSAQPRHTNDWAPRTWKRHQQEHRPQRPTERSDPTQHAKGRTGDCPGPRKEAATRRNVTQGGGGEHRTGRARPSPGDRVYPKTCNYCIRLYPRL